EGGNLTLYLGEMNPEHILFLYSFFQHIAENTLKVLETIYITLREDGNYLLFNIQMTLFSRPSHLYEKVFLQKAKAIDGEIFYEQNEDIHHITVRLERR
ncbi:MAG: hypothetical protein Q4Q17_05705, partial [Tissierellia bacterium]|nr:hypothetical protein [Tissierellia bacterium]